jgi:transcriptional regulator CtsR
LAVSIVPQTVLAESAIPYQKVVTDPSGRQLIQAIFPLPPQKIEEASVDMREMYGAGLTNTLSNVPAFDWSYGCAATSAAMLFGYYDRIGYSDMYTGTTNSGVCPLDNSVWGHTDWPSVTCGECPLSATHNGTDGRAIRGHVDDYWVNYGHSGPDPYVSNGWVEHTSDCTGDYMGTDQAKYNNTDGSTMFYFRPNGDPLYDYTGDEPAYRDGCHGMKLFAQSRGYTVVTNFNQLIQGQGSDPNKGFTFVDFQAEIDAGRPVLILVTGHAMVGYGYDTSTNTIYIHNTWDYSGHTMTWGGTYSGVQHFGVTVIRLNPSSSTAPSNLTATAISSSQINLTWQDNSSDETGFEIERKTGSGSYSQIATVGANVASYSDTYLSAGTTYYYRVRAYNAAGNSDYSNEALATTLSPPPPPSAPTLKSPASGSTVPTLTPRLEWNASSSATDYGLQVATTSSFTTLSVNQTGITNIYYDIAPGILSWNTYYYWRVNARNSYGTSSWSSYGYFKTALGPTPNAPSNLVATPISSSQIDLTWQDNSSDETGFKIERKTGSGSYSQIATVGAGVTSYSNTYLSAGTTYYYRVRAYNAAGNSDYSNEASATTLAPPPSIPTLKSPASGSTVATSTPRLEWNASSGATDYGLQVATTSSFTTLSVNQTGITGLYFDIAPGTLNWNTYYYWRVNARNSYGTSSWSSYRYFKTAVGPPPNAPSNLVATSISSSQINLSWQDNSTDETGFKVERKTGAGSYSQIATVGAGVTSYSNTYLSAGTTYYYRVRAYKGTLNSDYCKEASATTLAPPPSAPTLKSPASGSTVPTSTPRLEWNASSGAVSYVVQVSTSSSFTNLLVNETGITNLYYDIAPATLNRNAIYYWRVDARNSLDSTSSWSSYRYFRTPAGP